MKDRLNRSGWAALLLFMALGVAGCGTDQPARSQATPANPPTDNPNGDPTPTARAVNSTGGIDVSKVDACALLTRAEIEAVMGPIDNYAPKTRKSTVDEKRCEYSLPVIHDADNIEGKGLNVVVWPVDNWSMHQAVSGNGAPAVTGVGDEAYTSEYTQGLSLWAVDHDKAVIEVGVFPKDVEIAKKLALRVMEKLP